MLRKLMKYDFKATARLILPIYIALLVITAVCKLLFIIKMPEQLYLVQGLLVTTYILTMIFATVATLIIVIMNFYKNLVGSEGYLTFTLPVKTSSVIASKVITGAVWTIASSILAIFSLMVIVLDKNALTEIQSAVSMFSETLKADHNISLTFLAILWGAFMLVSSVVSLLQVYFSIALGQLMMKNKIIGSVVAYIIINIALQVLLTVLSTVLGAFFIVEFDPAVNQIAAERIITVALPVGMIILLVILGAVYLITTNYIFKKKLNLE